MALKKTLERILDQLSDYDRECFMDGYGPEELFDNELITVTNVDSYGGEDMGSDYWAVYSFSKDNEEVFVKFYGWYASHVGSEYQGYKFVSPQQKTVVVYE
jgi:hypothetical protein